MRAIEATPAIEEVSTEEDSVEDPTFHKSSSSEAEEQNISSIEVNHISKILKIMNCLEKSRFTWKYFCVYFNNYFTSVQLMIHLLTDDIYSCGTVRMNRRGFPDDLKGRLRLQRGQSVTRQKGNLTPFCVAGQNASGLSDDERSSCSSSSNQTARAPGIETDSTPFSKWVYKYMNGIDRHDQLRLKYPLPWMVWYHCKRNTCFYGMLSGNGHCVCICTRPVLV